MRERLYIASDFGWAKNNAPEIVTRNRAHFVES